MTYLARSIRGSALCAALLLAGCMNDSAAVRSPEYAFLPPERYPIAVEAQMAIYQIPLNAARNDVDPRRENDLRQIASDYLANGSGSIALSASGNDRNVTARVSDRLVVSWGAGRSHHDHSRQRATVRPAGTRQFRPIPRRSHAVR